MQKQVLVKQKRIEKAPSRPHLFVYPIPSSGVIAGKAATWVQVALLPLYLKTIATYFHILHIVVDT